MVDQSTFIRDTLFYIKNDLSSNITDPISAKRTGSSKFIMTSYPERTVQYPLITINITNFEARRVAMQSDAMDMEMNLEIRIWARNTKERDELFTDVFNRLRKIQFTGTGTVSSNLHDFNMPSCVEVSEEKIKSKIMQVTYRFYNFT